MGKILLQKITDNEADENTATVKRVQDNSALTALIQEMKSHLQDAAKDLLQPRKEAVDKLLKKVLH